ncbi:unnamed protein product [Linum trigynum]|uniref:Uncharacterized protein n=1 Tax=Linum trigynum TaxID=586398 RepID=A0AAV2DDB0_9ROSI
MHRKVIRVGCKEFIGRRFSDLARRHPVLAERLKREKFGDLGYRKSMVEIENQNTMNPHADGEVADEIGVEKMMRRGR